MPPAPTNVEVLPHEIVFDVPLHTYDAVQRYAWQNAAHQLLNQLLFRYRQSMLQQHALVCTVEGQQLHEAQVAQLIAATMAEECLSSVVQEFDSWYYSATGFLLKSIRSYFMCAGAAMRWRP